MKLNKLRKRICYIALGSIIGLFGLPSLAQEPSFTNKLKILIVTTTFPKLSETFVINQVNGLLSKGHDVYIFAEKQEGGKIHEDVIKHNLIARTYYKTLPADIDSYDVVICQFGPLGKKFLVEKKARGLKAKLVTFFRGFDISKYLRKNPEGYVELFEEGDLFLPNCEFLETASYRWVHRQKKQLFTIHQSIALDL